MFQLWFRELISSIHNDGYWKLSKPTLDFWLCTDISYKIQKRWRMEESEG